ncbi:MAG: winged helix-turn-helix domain-containing protein [Clostridiales bacterium]|jgi:DNA-binding SARP family transcriptional activator|nr:winged helix-turn-helix domain-containing protein [Clostridiales bacterium]
MDKHLDYEAAGFSPEAGDSGKIYVNMFGFFDILYKGSSILRNVGNSGKSLDILKFLIIQKGLIFLPEAIAANVWPANDYIDEKKVIRTYVHRLRKILAYENATGLDFSADISVLNIKGSYKAELSDNVIMDTDVFQDLCHQASKEEGTAELVRLFESIIGLYKRNFLEENRIDAWVVSFRNYYLRVFCQAVNTILDRIASNGDNSRIYDICEQSLKIYDLDEAINIHFLKAMIASDQLAGAMQHYTYITEKMHNELKIMPSDKMRAIYGQLQIDAEETPEAPRHGGAHQSAQAQLSPAPSANLADMIRNIVLEYQPSGSIAVGIVRIAPTDAEAASADSDEMLINLKFALGNSLRHGDSFVMTHDDFAVIVVQNAREEYYETIAQRINDAFARRLANPTHELDIKLYPARLV